MTDTETRTFKSSVFTKIVGGGIEVLFWWGASERQSTAQAPLMNHHIQENMCGHHVHHMVKRPNCQVRTILQRLPHPDNQTKQVSCSCTFSVEPILLTTAEMYLKESGICAWYQRLMSNTPM